MKKAVAILFVVLLTVFFVINHCLTFIYVVPQTNAESLPYIANIMKRMDSVFKQMEKASKKEKLPIKYTYLNAYGSGFIPKNEIPNDLDVALGVDFGEYEYTGDNAEEIAKSIVDKIAFLETNMNLGFKLNGYPRIVNKEDYFDLLLSLNRYRAKNIEDIKGSLDIALKDDSYVKYTVKNISETKGEAILIDVPYIMKAHEILYEDLKPLGLYSSLVVYNSDMPQYMREVTVIPEMTATIKHGGKTTVITIVPESFLGERLQLERRFYASNVFLHNSKAKLVENLPCLKDNDLYLYYRMLSFKRHLHVINNILVMEDRPIKLLKRFIQAADMVEPILTKEEYKEISDLVYTNLNNKDIQDLNEYINIVGLLVNYIDKIKLYFDVKEAGKLDTMFAVLEARTNSLESRGNVDKNTIKLLRDFYQKDLKDYRTLKTAKDVEAYADYVIKESNLKLVREEIDKSAYKLISNKDEMQKILNILNNVYYNAGYHRVTLYWLDTNLIGVIKDDFTKDIKDLKQFAKDNDLIGVNYKFITQKEADEMMLNTRYDVWGRYNPTKQEAQVYDDMINKLLADKKNFNVKRKTVWVN